LTRRRKDWVYQTFYHHSIVYELELFKETLPFKAFKPNQTSGNRLLMMSYEGNEISRSRPKNNLKNNATTLPTIITQFPKRLPTNMVQTNQSRLLLIVTKDS
jgi:hypothetical protein